MWRGFRWRSPESRREGGRRRRVRDVLHRLFRPHRRARAMGLKYHKLGTRLMNDHDSLDGEAQPLVDEGNSSVSKASDLTYTEALELQLKQYEKQGILPISPRVMRTISIHHLECDIYVQSGAKVTRDGPSHSKRLSLEDLSSLLSEQQELFEEKLKEARDSLLKHQNAGPTCLIGDVSLNDEMQFLDALELFHKNREKFLKVLQDPYYLSVNYLRDTKSFGNSPASTSFDQDGKPQPEIVPLISENDLVAAMDEKNLLGTNRGDLSVTGPDNAALETRNPSAFHRFQDIKRRIKDLIKDEKIGSRRIALDGKFDKIPVGHTAEEEGSVVDRYWCKNNFGSDRAASSANSRFGRSRSLSDSLDSYSRLLDSDINRGVHSHASDRFKLIDGGGVSQTTASSSHFGRIRSLPEYISYYPVELTHDGSLPIPLSGVAPLDVGQASALRESRVSVNEDLPGILLTPQDGLITVGEAEYIDENRIDDATSDITQSLSMDGIDVRTSDGRSRVSEEKVANDRSDDRMVGTGMECISGSAKMEPSSALEIDASSFPPIEEIIESKDSLETLKDDSVGDKDSEIDRKKQVDLDALRVDVQQKDMEEFDYIMEIMKRSGFRNSELQGRWHSPELPLDPALFKELEGISPDVEICSCVVDLNLDHLLLFDLTNEILLEIHETCSVPQLCSSRTCWGREGLLFLKEVWDNVGPYVSCPPRVDPKTDVLDQDFDPHLWLTAMRHGVQGILAKLEDLILDDMVDDMVNELLNSASLQCDVC